MKNLAFIFLCMISASWASGQSDKGREDVRFSKNNLALAIQRQATVITKYLEIDAPIFLTADEETSFAPHIGILINKSDLEKNLKGATAEDSLFIIRFLLGHEIAHRCQYKNDSVTYENEDRCNYKKVYEIQADYFAGEVLAYFYFTLREKLSPGLYFSWLTYISRIGEPPNSQDYHPSSRERMTAFRAGFGNGINDPKTDFGQETAKLKKLFPRVSNPYIGYLATAEEECRKVCHFPNETAIHIRIDSTDIQWHKPSSDMVSFTQVYENIGPYEVEVHVFPYIKFVPKNSDRFLLDYIGHAASQAYILAYQFLRENYPVDTTLQFGNRTEEHFLLKPGEKFLYRDSLDWAAIGSLYTDYTPQDSTFSLKEAKDFDLDKYMPELVLPNDAGSFYFVDNKGRVKFFTDAPCAAGNFVSSIDRKSVLIQSRFNYGMEVIKQQCYLNSLSDYLHGFASLDSGKTVYESSLRFPNSSSTWISLDRNTATEITGSYYDDYSIYNNNNKTDRQAEYTFSTMASALKGYLGNVGIVTSQEGNELKKMTLSYKDTELNLDYTLVLHQEFFKAEADTFIHSTIQLKVVHK